MTALRRLPRYVSPNPAGREVQDSVNALVDHVRSFPRFELVQFRTFLLLPFEIVTETITIPAHITANIWLAGRDEVAPGLTEFSWRALGDNRIEVHTLAGLTAGTEYDMTFLIVGTL